MMYLAQDSSENPALGSRTHSEEDACPHQPPGGHTADATTGTIFDIKRYAIHDGPGIRTTVFLKGCPARCLWCHNPESQSFGPEVVKVETRCAECGTCREVCPHGAPAPGSGVCTACGDCIEACPAGAREMAGRETPDLARRQSPGIQSHRLADPVATALQQQKERGDQ